MKRPITKERLKIILMDCTARLNSSPGYLTREQEWEYSRRVKVWRRDLERFKTYVEEAIAVWPE